MNVATREQATRLRLSQRGPRKEATRANHERRARLEAGYAAERDPRSFDWASNPHT